MVIKSIVCVCCLCSLILAAVSEPIRYASFSDSSVQVEGQAYTREAYELDLVSGEELMYGADDVEQVVGEAFTNSIQQAVNQAAKNSDDAIVKAFTSYSQGGWIFDETGMPLESYDHGMTSWNFGSPDQSTMGFENGLVFSLSTNGVEIVGQTPYNGNPWNYFSVNFLNDRYYLGEALANAGGGIKYDETFTNNVISIATKCVGEKYDETFTNIVISIVTNKQEVTFDTPWKLQSVSDPRVGNVYVKWITEDDPEYMWYQQTGWMVQGDYLMSMPNIDSTDPLATRIVFYNAIENPDTEERIDISGIFVREGASVLGFLLSTDTFTNSVVGVVDKVASERITTEVDNAMKEMLGDNWKTTYGTGLGGILAAILASIVWLKKQIGNAEEALRKL